MHSFMNNDPSPLARPADTSAPQAKPGRLPWKVTYHHRPMERGIAAGLDADGNELFVCVSPEIAGRIVGAVNVVECAHRADRGGPTVNDPDRPYCKPDQSCCDFTCGN